MEESLSSPGYRLDDQVGYLLRKAYQNHIAICNAHDPCKLTPMQFSTLYRLATEPGPISQNALGRLVAMDAATTKGVVTRLKERGLIESRQDHKDRRRYILSTTPEGRRILAKAQPIMQHISRDTLAPLNEKEQKTLLALLRKLS
ncbi:MarR family winged helix-turn-helix transcriptional regulator [Corticibacter populi]|nr:MarR family transcriptional regulator [Corticibacter populi]RZS31038.1 DNA-binding MarR family transcriptional regulator [Corticibacter populi]